MPISASLAVLAVADLDEAKRFYARLFDRVADVEPMPTLAQWDIEPGGGVQVVHDDARSGSCLLTLMVTDLEQTLTELSSRGITTGEVIEGVISRVTQTTDPAGNTITFAELTT